MTSLQAVAPTTSRHFNRITSIDAGAHGEATCAGTVVVHVDHSVECSAPGCPTGLDRRSWRALHARFVHCEHIGLGACPLCTLAAA
jgi:hypothetical protein